MLEVIKKFPDYQAVIAGAPGMNPDYYKTYTADSNCKIIFDQTYRLLSYSDAALVTSGTATLETSLFRVPQTVCYRMPVPHLAHWAFKNILHTPYISLVNLIANKEVVKELFAKYFSQKNIEEELDRLLNDKVYRNNMLEGYDHIINILGEAGASKKAADIILKNLHAQP